jgi:hypothetical protein
MSTASKIAAAVASGYLLGRTKKLRLAITVGSMLAGQRIATSPQGLLKQGSELIEKNPELAKLQKQISGRLFEAAKDAAISTATSRLESFSDSLRQQAGGDEDEDQQPEDEYDESEDEDEEEEDDERSRAEPSRRAPVHSDRGGDDEPELELPSRPSRSRAPVGRI